jgi:hypothetical protein
MIAIGKWDGGNDTSHHHNDGVNTNNKNGVATADKADSDGDAAAAAGAVMLRAGAPSRVAERGAVAAARQRPRRYGGAQARDGAAQAQSGAWPRA